MLPHYTLLDWIKDCSCVRKTNYNCINTFIQCSSNINMPQYSSCVSWVNEVWEPFGPLPPFGIPSVIVIQSVDLQDTFAYTFWSGSC